MALSQRSYRTASEAGLHANQLDGVRQLRRIADAALRLAGRNADAINIRKVNDADIRELLLVLLITLTETLARAARGNHDRNVGRTLGEIAALRRDLDRIDVMHTRTSLEAKR